MMGLIRPDLEDGCGLFQDAEGNPQTVQGKPILSSHAGVFFCGIYASRHDDSRRVQCLLPFLTIRRRYHLIYDSTRSATSSVRQFFDTFPPSAQVASRVSWSSFIYGSYERFSNDVYGYQ
jgi:hypothetical protein